MQIALYVAVLLALATVFAGAVRFFIGKKPAPKTTTSPSKFTAQFGNNDEGV